MNTNTDKKIAGHRSALVRFFMRRGLGLWDAEELSQEVFYKILHCNVDSDLIYNSAYLYRVARNLLNDFYRRDKAALQSPLCTLSDGEQSRESQNLVEVNAPEDYLVAERRVDDVVDCLSTMPTVRKAVMTKYLFEVFTQKALAHSFSVTEGAIEKHISLGKRQLGELALAS